MVLRSPKTRVHPGFTLSKSTVNDQSKSKTDDLDGAIRRALRATGYFVSLQSDINVDVGLDGRVLLRGTVPSYYHKQRAQVAVMSVAGIRAVQNDLVVESTD